MSDQSNEPKVDVSIQELIEETRISISETGNTAYVFIGKTPKAQLQIDLTIFDASSLKDIFDNKVRNVLMIKKLFPSATLEFQNDLIEVKFKSHPLFQWDVLKD